MKIMVNGATGFKGVIVKELNDMTMDELKLSYHVRLIENNKYPNSAFKKSIDEEMVEITKRIKKIRSIKS